MVNLLRLPPVGIGTLSVPVIAHSAASGFRPCLRACKQVKGHWLQPPPMKSALSTGLFLGANIPQGLKPSFVLLVMARLKAVPFHLSGSTNKTPLKLDNPTLQSNHRCVSSVVCAQLGEDVLDASLDRFLRY